MSRSSLLLFAIFYLAVRINTAHAQSTYERYPFTTVAGKAGNLGSADSTNAFDARFNTPFGVAIDETGHAYYYVADQGNHVIRKVVGSAVTTLAGLAGVSG